MVYGQFSVWILRQKLECDLWLALSYHEMYNDEALEYDGPCRVAQAVCEGAKYLGDTCLTGMRCNQDMFDILGLGGCKLERRSARHNGDGTEGVGQRRAREGHGYLDLGPALDALLEGARHELQGAPVLGLIACLGRTFARRGCRCPWVVAWLAVTGAPPSLSQHHVGWEE